MDITLNEKKVREMATRLRDALGRDQVSQAAALETLSKVFGERNWDTFSATLKRGAPRKFKLGEPVALYVNARSCDEWAPGPTWCKLVIDQAFINKLLELQGMCQAQGLGEVACGAAVAAWDEGIDLHIRDEELKVSAHSWWVSARPKHADYNVETRLMEIGWLLDALAKVPGRPSADFLAWHKDTLIYESAGETSRFVEDLVDAGELDESYLPD